MNFKPNESFEYFKKISGLIFIFFCKFEVQNLEMENSKKNSSDKKPNFVSEPETVYETENKQLINPPNTPEQEILLQKLLALGLKQSEMGLGISNEEMKRRTKLKFPFLK